MLPIVKADGAAELALIERLRLRAAQAGEEINRTAAAVMENVRVNGYDAVRKYSLQFDKAEPREFSQAELQAR